MDTKKIYEALRSTHYYPERIFMSFGIYPNKHMILAQFCTPRTTRYYSIKGASQKLRSPLDEKDLWFYLRNSKDPTSTVI